MFTLPATHSALAPPATRNESTEYSVPCTLYSLHARASVSQIDGQNRRAPEETKRLRWPRPALGTSAKPAPLLILGRKSQFDNPSSTGSGKAKLEFTKFRANLEK